jgi:hypothetical protein
VWHGGAAEEEAEAEEAAEVVVEEVVGVPYRGLARPPVEEVAPSTVNLAAAMSRINVPNLLKMGVVTLSARERAGGRT